MKLIERYIGIEKLINWFFALILIIIGIGFVQLIGVVIDLLRKNLAI